MLNRFMHKISAFLFEKAFSRPKITSTEIVLFACDLRKHVTSLEWEHHRRESPSLIKNSPQEPYFKSLRGNQILEVTGTKSETDRIIKFNLGLLQTNTTGCTFSL